MRFEEINVGHLITSTNFWSDNIPKVNKRDFLQGSGIRKIEDNLTSADLLSYKTTIMIPG